MAVLSPTAIPAPGRSSLADLLPGPWTPASTGSPARRISGVTALVLALMAAFLLTLVASAVASTASEGAAGQVRGTVSSAAQPAESAAFPAWTVRPGDTLWSVAQEVAPGADPRAVVLQLRVLNGLSPHHVLQAGQVLQVPGQAAH